MATLCMGVSFLLFIDESGQDLRESPYEVLAGVAVEDRDLWNLITAIHDAEVRCFGARYSDFGLELKAKKVLKTKVFRHAALVPEIDPVRRQALTRQCLRSGSGATPDQLAALAQAKISLARTVLEICARFRCRAFASIIPREAPRTSGGFLRKDYAYLFERFFYFLDDQASEALGLVVFDELERSRSHLLIDQMWRYFRDTETGRMRSGKVIPEPFFVHSELTTGVQLADFVAYLIAWGARVGGMTAPARPELRELGRLVCDLRYRSIRDMHGNPNFVVWSFAVIDDLRPREERDSTGLVS